MPLACIGNVVHYPLVAVIWPLCNWQTCSADTLEIVVSKNTLWLFCYAKRPQDYLRP
jgi:hypothetical protein